MPLDYRRHYIALLVCQWLQMLLFQMHVFVAQLEVRSTSTVM